MPNPLVGRQRNASQSQTQERQPLTPAMEDYAGQNNAWRGVEDHGVKPLPGMPEPEDWRDGRDVEYREPEEAAPPVPVVIVSEPTTELRRFRTMVRYAKKVDADGRGNGAEIIGQDEERSTVLIKNTSIDKAVYLSDSPETATPMTGFPLLSGDDVLLRTQTAIYATTSDTVNDLAVYLLVEYATDK